MHHDPDPPTITIMTNQDCREAFGIALHALASSSTTFAAAAALLITTIGAWIVITLKGQS